MKKSKIIFYLLLIGFVLSVWIFLDGRLKKSEPNLLTLQHEIYQKLRSEKELPEQINIENKHYKIQYSISEKLQTEVENILKKYKTDVSSVVIIDIDSGKILTAMSHDAKTGNFDIARPFLVQEPAASLFKIVTASALIDSKRLHAHTPFYFNGRKTTLYKKQIFSGLHEGRSQTDLIKAFAHSNNPAFAKVALRLLSPQKLLEHAKIYGFNSKDWDLGIFSTAHADEPTNDYEFAELASGFNISTKVTPVHAAMMAGIIGNDGKRFQLSIIESILENEDMEQVKMIVPEISPINSAINNSSNQYMRNMMVSTLKIGTASKHFRKILRKHGNHYELGGKTGSITGEAPEAKREWFAGYIRGKDQSKGRYAISVLNLNSKKWYIRASELAAEISERIIAYDKGISQKLAKN